MANFYTYSSDGKMTLTMICNILGCSKSDLITLNSQSYKDGMTVGQYLQLSDLKGEIVESGLTFKIPVGLTGGVNTKYSAYRNLSTLLTTKDSSDTKYNVHKSLKSYADYSGSYFGDGAKSHQFLRDRLEGASVKHFTCFMYALLNGRHLDSWYLPVYPNEFSDSNRPNFSQVGILGRSVDYQIYQGSSRDVSFTLQMHEELCSDYDYIHNLVTYIESACYPGYAGGIVQVPEIYFNIGSQFKIRGIITNCSANWKAPVIDGRLVNCDLSIGITETTGPYELSQVKSMGGRRG